MEFKIKDVLINYGSGATPSRKNKDYYKNGTILWLKTKELQDGKIYNTEEKISIEGYKNSNVKIFPENTITIAMYGATVGKLGILKREMTTNQACCNLVVDKNKADYRFLFYYLKHSRRKLVSLANGAAQQNLNMRTILDFPFLKISLPKQKQISDVLASFDQKIETNNAIIANLEAQAQAIFNSWFVNFEPFQNGEFVESELGMIPEGWEVGKLGNSSLGKLLSSGINDFENQKIYLATADVTDSNITNYETKITMEDKPSRANMQPIKNSVWFAKMKDSRKLIYVGANDDFLVDEVIFSTGFAGIKAVESSVHYLWTYLLTEDFNTKKNLLSNGTTMQAINNTNINRIKIVIPKNNVLEDFNGLVKPMFELISSYKNQNLKLAQIRDTLLPKLMSGEIRVGQDDIEEIENLL